MIARGSFGNPWIFARPATCSRAADAAQTHRRRAVRDGARARARSGRKTKATAAAWQANSGSTSAGTRRGSPGSAELRKRLHAVTSLAEVERGYSATTFAPRAGARPAPTAQGWSRPSRDARARARAAAPGGAGRDQGGGGDALHRLSMPEGLESLPYATVDHHRALRNGYPEVIFRRGKDRRPGGRRRRAHRRTRQWLPRDACARGHARADYAARFPNVVLNDVARTAWLAPASPPTRRGGGAVLIVTAGTSDIPVAEEAAVTACALGNRVERLTDVGVAGIHRVLAQGRRAREGLGRDRRRGDGRRARCVVGGPVGRPGDRRAHEHRLRRGFGGIAAYWAMLTSCASGVTVVNIDNGFGAALRRLSHQPRLTLPWASTPRS